MARSLAQDPRRIRKHLLALETLFVLHRVDPCPGSTGKSLYFPCDPGLTSFLGGKLRNQLLTWVLHEQLSQRTYRGELNWRISYFRGTRGGRVDFVIETPKEIIAIKVIDREKFDVRDFEIFDSFKKKSLPQIKKDRAVRLIALAPVSESSKLGEIHIEPWESLA
jgi:predicted AAA+ superfamily ATPase